MRFLIPVQIAILFIMASSAMGKDVDPRPFRIASYYIPLLVEGRECGTFMEVLREAAKRANIRYEIVLVPPKRAMRYFDDGEVMAVIPALEETLVKDSALTRPISIKPIHAIVRAGGFFPQEVQDLEGLRIGLTRGFSFPRSITVNEKIEIDYCDTTEGSLKKLYQGRVDVVVADGYSALAAIKNVGLDGFYYDLSVILGEQKTYIAFQPTETGRQLARRLSEALDSMETDGTLGRILPSTARMMR